MARLLTIASAALALGCAALAQYCPTSMPSTSYTTFTEVYAGTETSDVYYAISLVTPENQDSDNGNTNGCTDQQTFVTRYSDDDFDACSFYALTLASQTEVSTGCLYHFVTDQGNDLIFNMSCSDNTDLDFDTDATITTSDGKNHTYFSGYSNTVCTPTSATTETDGPTVTWTDGPTQTWTDGPTQTYTDGPTQTWTDGPTQTYTDGTTTSATPVPITTTAFTNYTNATFYTSESSGYWVVYYIQDFLNESRGDYSQGTITAWCNTTYDRSGNYTCVATFSNYTQAVESVYGANHGYIAHVFAAYFGDVTTTVAPYETTIAPHSDTASAMGILIGAMAGLMIFLALLSLIYILVARRRPTYGGDYEHLSEMNRANSNLKRV